MRKTWDVVLTSTLVICALITTALVVHRQFSPSAASARPALAEPVFIANWKSHLEHGVLLGSSSAPVQLIEFADFECPFCASFHRNLKTLRDRYPTQVALSFIHLPLPNHRFAEPAARAAECAAEQGRFEPMYDRLFEQQNRFGLAPWTDFALQAQVPDTAAFEVCIKSTAPIPRIEAGKQLATQLDVRGTPTLIVNGWKLGHSPSIDELDRMVKAVLNGRKPVS